MNEQNRPGEERKQRALERFGTNEPSCFLCGETDWRCLELHHVAGRKHNPITVIVCANCHRKLSDDQKDHPAFDCAADPFLSSLGHFLLGLADMLSAVVEKLREFGRTLIDRAKVKGTATEVFR